MVLHAVILLLIDTFEDNVNVISQNQSLINSILEEAISGPLEKTHIQTNNTGMWPFWRAKLTSPYSIAFNNYQL